MHLNKLQRTGMLEPYNNQMFIRREERISLPQPQSQPKVQFIQPKEEKEIEKIEEDDDERHKQGMISGTFTNIVESIDDEMEKTEEEEENVYGIPNFGEPFERNCPRAIMIVEKDGTKTFYKSKLDYHQKTKKRMLKSFLRIGETSKVDKDTVAVAITRSYMKENS